MRRIARLLAGVAAAWLAATAPVLAQPDPEAFLGRTVVELEVESDGRPFLDAQVLELVETRVGEMLTMRAVRETIDHLVGLGRFEDVRVAARDAGDGVVIRYVLVPVRRIRDIELRGTLGLPASALRTELLERHGARPSAVRLNELVDTLQGYYRERGYARARITPVLEASRAPEDVTAVFTIEPGPRTLISTTTVAGASATPPSQLLTRLGVEAGRPYDRQAIEARLADYEEDLRARGYYEADVSHRVVEGEDGRSVSLTVQIDQGPRVRVVFTGDPLSGVRQDSLVPIRRERSVDEDLLEDASRGIETFLRTEGYRAAEAPYTRREEGGELVLTFQVSRGPLHRLASVEVTGLSALARADLAPLLQIAPGEAFVDARVGTVAAAITELYRVRGFTRATVTPDVRVRAAEGAGRQAHRPVDVRFDIVEGPQTLVRALAFNGAQALPAQQLQQFVGLAPGRPYYLPQLVADRDALERAYRNTGFQSAVVDVEPVISPEGDEVEIRYRIREGLQTIVDHILITGNRRTSAEIIRRELLLAPGDPLGYDALLESQQRLSALGLFRRVRITDLPHGGSVNRDLVVEVEEAPSTTVSYGGGLEVGQRLRSGEADGAVEERIEVAPRAFFEVGRRNLWGKNRAVNLFTRVSLRPRDPGVDATDPDDEGGYGLNEYRIVGTFREPRAFSTAGDAQFTAFLEQAIRSSFNFNRRGVRAEYAKRLTPQITASGRYTYDRTRLFDIQVRPEDLPEDQFLIDRIFPQVRLSTIAGSLLRDSRDDVLDPQGGTVLGADGELAVRSLGSEVGYAKSFLQGFVYRRLPRSGFVVAAGARVGLARGFERTVAREDADGSPVTGPDGEPLVDVVQDLPASQRFFAGGDTTVRGFSLDRLGSEATLSAQGFPTGGAGLIVLNLELRAPYWKGLGLVTFADAGNVFRRAGDIAIGDLRGAAGLGLRYRSPLGPLRFDLGFKLDRRAVGDGLERRVVFHISLGQAF